MKFVDIVGSGAWGTTLAMLLAENRNASVRILAREEEVANSIRHSHINRACLPGICIPEKVKAATIDSASFSRTTHLVLATPAQYLRNTLRNPIFRGLDKKALILHAAKGIEDYSSDGKLSGKRMSEVIGEELNRKTSVLSGPNLAREVAQKRHACSVVASQNKKEAEAWKELLTVPGRFSIETSSDVAGVEVAGALKNTVAIGAGINDGISIAKGLKESCNEKAEIIIKALGELIAYGTANGADRETFYGIAGMGDIMATCFSSESRNLFVGQETGKGRALKGVLEELKRNNRGEPEGPETVKIVRELSRRMKIKMPLTEACYNVLFKKANPEEEIKRFLSR